MQPLDVAVSSSKVSKCCWLNLYHVSPWLQSTPKIKGMSKKEGAKRKMNMSGYILFSSEMRAVIKAQHPDFSFGELSRLVGTEWRNLDTSRKAEYEGELDATPLSRRGSVPSR